MREKDVADMVEKKRHLSNLPNDPLIKVFTAICGNSLMFLERRFVKLRRLVHLCTEGDLKNKKTTNDR